MTVQWHPVAGIRCAAVEAGIKKAHRRDLVVFEIAAGSTVAGVFTRNRFCAAPVQVAREHLGQAVPRYLLINTGYANAGTGQEGLDAARTTCELLAGQAGCTAAEVLPFSTGVIGERFPLQAFERGIPLALQALSEQGWSGAAEGIMTTDTRPKLVSRQVQVEGRMVTITGIAKGAGMIKPNMATMLGFVATDAVIDQTRLQQWLRQLADLSFNRVTVDGDTSTNDACMLVATGQSGVVVDDDQGVVHEALRQVMVELAQLIVRDGEGATKFVEIRVEGAASEEDARQVGETVAHSPLVKTALFASDPNWGRILAAVGRAPIPALDVERVGIWLGPVQIVHQGSVAPDYTEARGAAVMAEPEITIRIDLGAGTASTVLWTCDFSYDYVKINAEYRS